MRPQHFPGDGPFAPDDASLLARAAAGDAGAFRAIFLRHGPAVRRLLGGLCGDAAAADEATQETFVRAHQALPSVRDAARLRWWLLGIARIIWLDETERQRRNQRFAAPLDEGAERLVPSPECGALDAEADSVLSAALSKLGRDRRAALILRLDQGLGYGEIGQIMGWPIHKVKNEIHRGRLQIRGELLAYLRGTA